MSEDRKPDLESIEEIEKKIHKIKSDFEEIGRETGMTRSNLVEMEGKVKEMGRVAEVTRSKLKAMRSDACRSGFDFEVVISRTGIAEFDFEETGRNLGKVRSSFDELKEEISIERARIMEWTRLAGELRADLGEGGKNASMRKNVFELLENRAGKLRDGYKKLGGLLKEFKAMVKLARSAYKEIEREAELARSEFKKLEGPSRKTTKKPPLGTRSYYDEMANGIELARSELRELEKNIGVIGSDFVEIEKHAYRVQSEFKGIGREAGRIRSDFLNRLAKPEHPQESGAERQGSVPPYELQPENLRVVIRDTDTVFKISPEGHLDPIRRRILALADEIRVGLKRMEAKGAPRSVREDFVIAKNREILEAALVDFDYDAHAGNPHLSPATFQLIAWELKDLLTDHSGRPGRNRHRQHQVQMRRDVPPDSGPDA